jgi:hypothetical protein
MLTLTLFGAESKNKIHIWGIIKSTKDLSGKQLGNSNINEGAILSGASKGLTGPSVMKSRR